MTVITSACSKHLSMHYRNMCDSNHMIFLDQIVNIRGHTLESQTDLDDLCLIIVINPLSQAENIFGCLSVCSGFRALCCEAHQSHSRCDKLEYLSADSEWEQVSHIFIFFIFLYLRSSLHGLH